jgi:hypothetical protein
MCGPSNAEKQAQGAEAGFMDTLMANYGTNFASQQQILNHLNGILNPIVAAGPNQTGFNPAEKAALETTAIDTTGAGAAAAERAVQTATAGRNDSGNLPESGVDQALKEQVASGAEGKLSDEELGIQEADYATGRSNFNNAVAAEEGVAGQFNPVGTAGAANNANQAAFGEASEIEQQQGQMESDIAGGISSLAGGVIGGIGNLDTTGGSTGGEQVQNFLAGF